MGRKSEDAWQILRIQGEFTKGFDTFNDLGPCISVFGSARTKESNVWYKEAEKFGGMITKEGYGVITGGGPVESGMNEYVQKGVENRYFFTRKVMFLKYSQGFVVFPGGLGTLDEFFEALTLAQCGHNISYPIVLVGKKYWGGLLDWLTNTVNTNGMVSLKDFDLFQLVDTAEEATEIITIHRKNIGETLDTNF